MHGPLNLKFLKNIFKKALWRALLWSCRQISRGLPEDSGFLWDKATVFGVTTQETRNTVQYAYFSRVIRRKWSSLQHASPHNRRLKGAWSRQQVLTNSWYLSTKSHGITFHKRTRASANKGRKLPTALTHGNGISGQSVTKADTRNQTACHVWHCRIWGYSERLSAAPSSVMHGYRRFGGTHCHCLQIELYNTKLMNWYRRYSLPDWITSYFVCTMTNKCTIISQIITFLHVSTLSCHPQGACNQYLAKLHQHFKCSCR